MADGRKVWNQKLPRISHGRNKGVSREDAIARIPVVVVELPRVDVPLPVVGVPVHVHDVASDSRT